MTGKTSSVTLRALAGRPLADENTRNMVIATAHAIAERQGVEVNQISADDTSVTVSLCTGRIESLGFAAELRRITTAWYTKKYGEPTLWGEPLNPE